MRKVLKWTAICIAGVVALVAISPWIFPRNPFMSRSGCPILAWLMPIDHSEFLPGDYLEWRLSPGLSTWYPFYVRIYGDGRVERDTVETRGGFTYGCPLHPADRTARISPAGAKKLLSEAREGGFCRLCSFYNTGVMDLGTSTLTLSLHGRVKAVQDHTLDPPQLIPQLTKSVLELTNMNDMADSARFSPVRKAECGEFFEEERHRYEQRGH